MPVDLFTRHLDVVYSTLHYEDASDERESDGVGQVGGFIRTDSKLTGTAAAGFKVRGGHTAKPAGLPDDRQSCRFSSLTIWSIYIIYLLVLFW